MRKAIVLVVAALAAALCAGCFEAPQAVRDNSQLERSLWVRYVARTDKAIQSRNEAIRTLAEGRNREIYERNLARANEKFADAQGKGDVEQVKQWTLAAVEKKQEASQRIEDLIASLDAEIAADQATVKAALGLHDKGDEWVSAGVDKTAVNGIFDLVNDAVPALKSSEVK